MAFADLCPDCSSEAVSQNESSAMDPAQAKTPPASVTAPRVPRRDFVQVVGTVAASASIVSVLPNAAFAKESVTPKSETLDQELYESLSEKQREVVCFDRDHNDKKRGGVLRRNVQANCQISRPRGIWHYRGDPHVHVWVNVASDPSIRITTG